MKKQLSGILFVFLLFAMLASAAPSIILNSPADKTTITEYTQTFMFSFDQDPAVILNCSLIVNDEVKVFRNAVILRNNNKINLGLEGGEYAWHVSCIDESLNVIDSATRAFTVSVGSEVKEGYEVLYNTNGLRSYILTIASGQKQVTLPAMKGGEDIQIKMSGKTYYVDLKKMGNYLNTTFVEIRDRSSGKSYQILTLNTLQLDFNNDKTMDIELLLKNVERGVNAYFAVTPYPAAEEIVPEEEPTTPPTIPNEIPDETHVTQPVEQPAEDVTPEEEPQEELEPGQGTVEEQEDSKSGSKWLVPIILVIVLAVILAIVLSSKAKRPENKIAVKEAKKQTPEQEQHPPAQEKFEIIKSSGKKGRI
jgi:uncharacterized protein YpmB